MRACGPLLANRCDGVDSIGLRHAQIHERYVRPVGPITYHRFFAVGRLRHHGHIGLRHNGSRNPAPQQRMIVYCKHANRMLGAHGRNSTLW